MPRNGGGYLLAFWSGVAAFFITVAAPLFLDLLVWAADTISAALWIFLWGLAGLACYVLARWLLVRTYERGRTWPPRHAAALAASFFAGTLFISLIMVPMSWNWFFAAWASQVRGYWRSGIVTGSAVNVELLKRVFTVINAMNVRLEQLAVAPQGLSDLTFMFQIHCVLLYVTCCAGILLISYGLVTLLLDLACRRWPGALWGLGSSWKSRLVVAVVLVILVVWAPAAWWEYNAASVSRATPP